MTRTARCRLAVVVVVLAAVALPGPTAARAEGKADVVLDGKGFGHGVGMAQDGALALGAAGNSTAEILATFYPGTVLGRAVGSVDVSVVDARPAVEVGFPSGGQVGDSLSGAQSPGFPITVVAGGSVRLSIDGGRYRATPLAGATPAPVANSPPGDPTAAPPDPEPTSERPLWAVPAGGTSTAIGDHRYRGVLEASVSGGGLHVVNRVDVEQYLRGMGEILEPDWPPAALRAQAIAARTYAVKTIRAGRTLCANDQCQVYLGATAEYPAMDSAVAATEGQVLLYGGSLAEAVYSASGGGISATPAEGFGDSDADYPYLRAAPYPTQDPEPWTVRSGLADMAARFGYGAGITEARVSRVGPSGRALEVTFEGDTGPLVVDARRFATVLKLRSTLFTLRVDIPPPPALPGGTPQAGTGGLRISSPPALLYGEPAPPDRRRWILAAFLLLAGAAAATLAACRPPPTSTGSRKATRPVHPNGPLGR